MRVKVSTTNGSAFEVRDMPGDDVAALVEEFQEPRDRTIMLTMDQGDGVMPGVVHLATIHVVSVEVDE